MKKLWMMMTVATFGLAACGGGGDEAPVENTQECAAQGEQYDCLQAGCKWLSCTTDQSLQGCYSDELPTCPEEEQKPAFVLRIDSERNGWDTYEDASAKTDPLWVSRSADLPTRVYVWREKSVVDRTVILSARNEAGNFAQIARLTWPAFEEEVSFEWSVPSRFADEEKIEFEIRYAGVFSLPAVTVD